MAGSKEGMRQRLDSVGFGLVGKRLQTRDRLGQQRLVVVKVKKETGRVWPRQRSCCSYGNLIMAPGGMH